MLEKRRVHYDTLEARPLAGALGAEIVGVDLAKPIKKEVLADIHRAWLDHQMIYFRDQDLTPELQVRFAKKWGGIHVHPFMPTMPGHPEILELLKTPKDQKNFGNLWHTDQSFMPKPAKATILYAVEVPPYGGDTLYSNMYAAYDALSPGMKELLADIQVENTGTGNKTRGGQLKKDRYKGHSTVKPVDPPKGLKTINFHPLIRTHPETGRKSLFISSHTQGFKDFSLEDALPLINYLRDYIQRAEFTCRLHWEPGTLAMWDNRCVMHYAMNDYPAHRRYMRRITIKGDKPR
jgi:taurine dioxygenase